MFSDDPLMDSNPYRQFKNLCLEMNPHKKSELLVEESVHFASKCEKINQSVEQFKQSISSIPFLSVILFWGQQIVKDKILGINHLNLMRTLIERKLIPIFKSKAVLMTFQDYTQIDHEAIINRIRSNQELYIQKREELVSFYVFFSNWVSQITYGYIENATDTDRKIAARRRLHYESYIELLSLLPERERLLTKLYYLGGERSLDEVLSLEVRNVDFAKHIIHFSDHFVRYPAHVVEDLKIYIGEREKGFVFKKKKGSDRINHTVPYRAFKQAIKKLNLPSSFSFRDLVREF